MLGNKRKILWIDLFNWLKLNLFKRIKNSTPDFKFVEAYRNELGNQIIVAKIIDSFGKSFKYSATELVKKRKDILSRFSIEDIVNIIGLAAIEKEPAVTQIKTTSYKYFAFFAMLYGCALVTANIASSKLVTIFNITMTGGTFPYLCSYALGDILTEVYGYKRARQLIWGAVACNIFAVMFIYLAIKLPSAEFWGYQTQYKLILGSTQRIMVSSMISFLCSEFLNSYMLSKLKVFFRGELLGIRILLSSAVSIIADTTIFTLLSYYGNIPAQSIMSLFVVSYLSSVIWEIFTIPFSMMIIVRLKERESLDIFDINTDFTPFSLDVSYDDKLNNGLRDRPPCLA